MPQISTLLSEEDVKILDKLVEKGVFKSRNEVIIKSINFLSNQEIEYIKKMNEGEMIVDNFLLDNIGDMSYAETPSIEIWKGKKVFKYPVKTEHKKFTLGHIYIDPTNMTIIEELSDSVENVRKTCESISTDSND